MNTVRKALYAPKTMEDKQKDSLNELDKKYIEHKRMVC